MACLTRRSTCWPLLHGACRGFYWPRKMCRACSSRNDRIASLHFVPLPSCTKHSKSRSLCEKHFTRYRQWFLSRSISSHIGQFSCDARTKLSITRRYSSTSGKYRGSAFLTESIKCMIEFWRLSILLLSSPFTETRCCYPITDCRIMNKFDWIRNVLSFTSQSNFIITFGGKMLHKKYAVVHLNAVIKVLL